MARAGPRPVSYCAGSSPSWAGAIRCPCSSFSTSPRSPSGARSRPGPVASPNHALRIDRVYIVVPDLAPAIQQYSRVLGLPVPPVQRGAVIKADMAVFDLGPTGLTIARPAEPGPADEALRHRGPGPFQVLYRTGSMDAAARWITEHGVPAPARGIRNNGEQAMLVGPSTRAAPISASWGRRSGHAGRSPRPGPGGRHAARRGHEPARRGAARPRQGRGRQPAPAPTEQPTPKDQPAGIRTRRRPAEEAGRRVVPPWSEARRGA
mgnify:CR=1 FL=1